MARDAVFGNDGDDELFGGPEEDLLSGGDGNDQLIGNFGSDLLLGGRGDDALGGDNPFGPPHTDAFDICNGQQDTDLALPGSCEREISIEGDFVPPED